jgi:hypothetical protein
MDATLVDERLTSFDLARVLCGGSGIGPLPRPPDVLLVNASSAKSS